MVQDARAAGAPGAGSPDSDGRSTTSFHLAYVEAHSPETHPSFVRIGRQEVTWGEGRLLGASDWRLVPRALDAARARLVVRQLDVEALAALLAPPEALPPDESPTDPRILGSDNTTGAQLYGLDFTLHADPLPHPELAGIARG